jgi:hypothetical protein
MRNLAKKLWESVISVLPIAVFVIILALSATDIDGGIIGLFAVGAVLSVLGIGFFTLGADVALMPMGGAVGARLSKTKSKAVVFVVCFVLGIIITIAEPDLQILAGQLQDGPGVNQVLVYSVAGGVGLFLLVSLLRTYFNFKLKHILIVAYGVVMALTIAVSIVNPSYVPLSFDAGGVTTGPVTVPFLLSLCIGIASVRGGRSNDDSFGAVALCSIGPVIAVLILGLSGQVSLNYSYSVIPEINGFGDILNTFIVHVSEKAMEVLIALAPIAAVFFLFQIFTLKLPKAQIIRIIVGIIYSYVGLVIFLTAATVGFVPLGSLLGGELGGSNLKWLLIPIGFVLGILIVLAEPAVHVLNKQVEDITGGAISKKTMLIALSIAIAFAIALSMTRVLTGINALWFIVPVYVIAVALSFFVPPIFTGIAFDSGGVASGSLATALVLPFAIGACGALGGNIFTDAFGLIAFVAMMPLITIQLLGLIYRIKLDGKSRSKSETAADIIETVETIDEDLDEEIVDFDLDGMYDIPTVITHESADLFAWAGVKTKDGAVSEAYVKTEAGVKTRVDAKTEDSAITEPDVRTKAADKDLSVDVSRGGDNSGGDSDGEQSKASVKEKLDAQNKDATEDGAVEAASNKDATEDCNVEVASNTDVGEDFADGSD